MTLALTELAESVSGTNGGAGYGTSAYTQSVTTVSGELLVVAVMGLTNGAADVTGLSISGGSLTYTLRQSTIRADSFGAFVAWYTAPVTTGATFNLSLDATDDIYQWGVWAASVSGYNAVRPVHATGTSSASGSANAVTVTLDRNPRAGSIVLSAMAQDASTGAGAVTEGSDFAQVFENNTGVLFHVMSDTTSPDNTVEYTDISAGGSVFSYAIGAIELVDAITGPQVVDWATAAVTTRSPSVTFNTVTTATDDIVLFFPSSTTTATITIPANWVNVLGGTTDVESDAHQICGVYHVITSGEAGTQTWTTTNLYDATETGNVVAALIRGVNTASVIDDANSTFDSGNAATPHVLASLTGANLATGSLVLSCVAADATLTYTQPTGWTFVQTSNTNQGKALLERFDRTTASTNVDATNITPSGGDEYASITVALTAGSTPDATAPISTITTGAVPAFTISASQTAPLATITSGDLPTVGITAQTIAPVATITTGELPAFTITGSATAPVATITSGALPTVGISASQTAPLATITTGELPALTVTGAATAPIATITTGGLPTVGISGSATAPIGTLTTGELPTVGVSTGTNATAPISTITTGELPAFAVSGAATAPIGTQTTGELPAFTIQAGGNATAPIATVTTGALPAVVVTAIQNATAPVATVTTGDLPTIGVSGAATAPIATVTTGETPAFTITGGATAPLSTITTGDLPAFLITAIRNASAPLSTITVGELPVFTITAEDSSITAPARLGPFRSRSPGVLVSTSPGAIRSRSPRVLRSG